MLELRKDPIIGRWVIISTARGKRPVHFEEISYDKSGSFCPFCPGNESNTPNEIFSIKQHVEGENRSQWSLRVVPNKFPALQIEGHLRRRADGLYDKMNGVGAHEVIIESPVHDMTLAKMPVKNIADVLTAYRERIIDLKKDKRFKYVMVFKNHGRSAGASLAHSHSQLIATPIVPKRVSEELRGSKSYYNYKERCVFCDIIEQELEDKIRIIDQTNRFIAISPYAPRFPFETWILPKYHESFFEKTDDTDLLSLASIFASTLKRLNIALENPPYNFLLHNTPFDYHDIESYHWHFEIMPKSTHVAGFEWGTGFYINPTPPEDSAEFLRDVDISQTIES